MWKFFRLDQAFILPFPQSARSSGSEERGLNPYPLAQLRMVALGLEKLKSGKISWDSFASNFSLLDSIFRCVTTKDGENILHLAVLSDLDVFPSLLVQDKILLMQRNRYGHTPLELSHLLRRGKCLNPSWVHEESLFYRRNFVEIMGEPSPCLSFFSCPVFDNLSIFRQILESSWKAKMKDGIRSEKTWMGIYFDEEIQEGFHPSVLIRFIDERMGFGVFAKQRISVCSYVGEYTGVIEEKTKTSTSENRYCIRYDTWEMGRRTFQINAEKGGNFTRFINHSRDPNLSLQSVYWRGMPRMIFIALKEIEEGTQLTFDYDQPFFRDFY